MSVSRVYDFVPGTKIRAQQVDDELNNLITAINENILAINDRYTKAELDSATRDHKGTWRGLSPEMVGDALLSQRIAALEARATIAKGSANFNSTVGTIIAHDYGSLEYVVRISPTQNPNGFLGEVWVEKALNSFKVLCSGSATTSFDFEMAK
ncbi:hypothetical protein [Brevibacillus centrosporus]|uniref:hypothetical protein n=1 Tax=Brevibacillus centrosporus TaxID=54910 RepID=UPI002E1A3496|nr:hypothetical protein [Brevibacillus centrosporus]